MFMNWKVIVEAYCSITSMLVSSSSPGKYSNEIAQSFVDIWYYFANKLCKNNI